MATNDSTIPATQNAQTITGTAAADTYSGGLGSDTIGGGDGNDTLHGDGAPAGAWHYETFNRDFSSANNQAFTIQQGVRTGSGYVTDFNESNLTNSLRGTPGANPDDFGIIYTSTLRPVVGGTYRLATTSDDGSTIQIFDAAGNPLNFANQTGGTLNYLNNDFHQGATTRYGDVVLQPGQTYTIQIRYWENAGEDALSATITGPDKKDVPQNLLTSPLLGPPPGPTYSATGTAAGVEGNDSLDGGAGDDTIFGDGGNDVLRGGIGNDALFGGAGNDSLSGDAGNDSLTGGDGDDTLLGDAGIDTLQGGAGDDVLTGGLGADNLSGGDGADRIVVTDADGTDTISGGEGGVDRDTLVLQDDTTTAGVNVTFTAAEAGTYTFNAAPAGGVAATGTFTQIEAVEATIHADRLDAGAVTSTVSLYGLAGNDSLIGSSGADVLDGGDGADSLSGGLGADTLSGGAGNDLLNGGAGNDTLFGGDGADGFGVYDTSERDVIDGGEGGTDQDGIDFFNSATTAGVAMTFTGSEAGTFTFGAATGSFTGIETIQATANADTINAAAATTSTTLRGLAGDDVLTGGAAADLLDGGAGRDTLAGGLGGDILNAGSGMDFASYAASDAGVVVNLATGAASGGHAQGDTFQGVDGIIGSGFDDVLTGADGESADPADTYTSIIYGGGGNDRIDGGGGSDTLDGGSGDDSLIGGTGNDTVTGGTGNDAATGGDGNDQIDGGDGGDSLDGGDGDDSLSGGAGDDSMTGGAGSDRLFGGDGNDALYGGTGSDTLDGGSGNDAVQVSTGDTAFGGGGDDVFTLANLGGVGGPITITGGEGGETTGDTLDLARLARLDSVVITNGDDAAGGFSGTVTLLDGSTLTFSEIERFICFTAGTLIATTRGARPVDDLRSGDMVITRDHGLQPIRWTGTRSVPALGRLAPIRIRPGVVPGLERDLVVSPQHRMLFQGYRAELLFGESEVLIPARHLVDGHAVTRDEGGMVTYVHILFDSHEIVYAEGAATESFHPGEVGLDAVDAAAREEMFALFPALRSMPTSYGPAARRSLKAHEARMIRP